MILFSVNSLIWWVGSFCESIQQHTEDPWEARRRWRVWEVLQLDVPQWPSNRLVKARILFIPENEDPLIFWSVKLEWRRKDWFFFWCLIRFWVFEDRAFLNISSCPFLLFALSCASLLGNVSFQVIVCFMIHLRRV